MPAHIVTILVVSIITLALLRRLIKTTTERIIRGTRKAEALARRELPDALVRPEMFNNPRREQRARTVATVLRSAATLTVVTIATLMILDRIGVNIAPLVASAGIAGVALGFGAQTLVKDFLSGIFLLLEDQFGVGDTVYIGDVTGTVESVALRVTRIRDADGVMWTLRNGEILKVGNQTQGWSRASVPVRVAFDCDMGQLHDALLAAADRIRHDEVLADSLQGEPTVGGIEAMTSQSLTVRVSVRTDSNRMADVTAALRDAVRGEIEKRSIPLAPDVPKGLLS
ncbi:mechanosensitive ion channel family protein [Rarobacter incanus]|uniref:mechanosensitive ion channel family protein n=1 Tax=Rarobacter incanus TaxID=153494 RepID=UPI001B87A777|nr:mechanosensitive ion channel family protein [Rarobacter incanus]